MVTHSQGLPGESGTSGVGRSAGPALLDSPAAVGGGGQDTELVAEALKFLALGLSPFPINATTKKPHMKWKALQAAPPTEEEGVRAFTDHPNAAIGVVTGHVDGIDVVDLDVDADGHLRLWPDEPNPELPKSLVIQTPRGGLHYAFKHTPSVRNSAKSLAPTVDVRGEGGYFIAAGPGRKILHGSFEEALSTAPPEWLRKEMLSVSGVASRIARKAPTRPGSLSPEQVLAGVPEGKRDDTLFRYATSMHRRGLEEAEAVVLIERAARACQPGFDVDVAREKVERLWGRGEEESPFQTDVGNARRFASANKWEARYSHPGGEWLVWNGKLWGADRTGKVVRLAKDVVRGLYREASLEPDSQVRKNLSKWATKSESQQRIRAMLDLARSEPGIPILPEALNGEPLLLNLQNGTLDLRTGKLRSHDPGNLITRICGTSLEPDSDCPRFVAFLEEIMDGDREMIAFLQRVVGYSLTGSTEEQVIFILYGSGSNGKTTLIEALRAMLGDYAVNADPQTFMIQRHSGPRPDLARLAGARLVTGQETEANQRLAESLVKQVSGGDVITVRFLYGREFEFRPQFKPFLVTNHRPVIVGTDLAIWRRVLLLPFEVSVPPERQDKRLLQKLLAELPGILAWAVEGRRIWSEEGLNPPARVIAAKQEYREEMDLVGRFLAERCTLKPHAETKAADLYREFQLWVDEVGEKQVSQRGLATRLRERGFEPARTSRSRLWKGIEIRRDDDAMTFDDAAGESFPREALHEELPEDLCHERHCGPQPDSETLAPSEQSGSAPGVTHRLSADDAMTQDRVAKSRTRTHARHASTRALSPDYDLVGVAGEMAFAREFELEIDKSVRQTGDHGVDFVTMAGSVDVKTYRRPKNLLREVGKPHAEILVLAKFDDVSGEAELVGWEWDSEMVACPVRDFGHEITNHYKPAAGLRPIEELHRLNEATSPVLTRSVHLVS